MKFHTYHVIPGEENTHVPRSPCRPSCSRPQGDWPLARTPSFALKAALLLPISAEWRVEVLRELCAQKTEGEFPRRRRGTNLLLRRPVQAGLLRSP